MLLLPSSCSSLCSTSIRQDALFMEPSSQTQVYTSSVRCVCIYFNWIPPKSSGQVRYRKYSGICGTARSFCVNKKIMFNINDALLFFFVLPKNEPPGRSKSISKSILGTLIFCVCRRLQAQTRSQPSLTDNNRPIAS